MDRGSAIVFGGSRGIGRTIAEAFTCEGFTLTVVSRTPDELKEIVRSLAGKGDAYGAVADVSDYKTVNDAIEGHVREFGTLDVVINTAAMQGPIGMVWETDPQAWHKAIVTNLGSAQK